MSGHNVLPFTFPDFEVFLLVKVFCSYMYIYISYLPDGKSIKEKNYALGLQYGPGLKAIGWTFYLLSFEFLISVRDTTTAWAHYCRPGLNPSLL